MSILIVVPCTYGFVYRTDSTQNSDTTNYGIRLINTTLKRVLRGINKKGIKPSRELIPKIERKCFLFDETITKTNFTKPKNIVLNTENYLLRV